MAVGVMEREAAETVTEAVVRVEAKQAMVVVVTAAAMMVVAVKETVAEVRATGSPAAVKEAMTVAQVVAQAAKATGMQEVHSSHTRPSQQSCICYHVRHSTRQRQARQDRNKSEARTV